MYEWWPIALFTLGALGAGWVWYCFPRSKSVIGLPIDRIIEVQIFTVLELEPMFGRRHPHTTAYMAHIAIPAGTNSSRDHIWSSLQTHLELNGIRARIEVLGVKNHAAPTMILHGRTCIPLDGLTLTCAPEDHQEQWPLTVALASTST